MEVRYSKKFVKQLAKQPETIKHALKLRVQLFEEDQHHPFLRNHTLHGDLEGYYSINITGDVRAIYEIVDNKVYLYQMIGTHSQLYG